MKHTLLTLALMAYCSLAFTQENVLQQLLERAEDSLLQEVLAHPEQFQLQLIYTRIDRDADNRPTFTSYPYNVDSNLYFYPASTVKMPAAFLAVTDAAYIGRVVPVADPYTAPTPAADESPTTRMLMSASPSPDCPLGRPRGGGSRGTTRRRDCSCRPRSCGTCSAGRGRAS